jgi:hypothetical protein
VIEWYLNILATAQALSARSGTYLTDKDALYYVRYKAAALPIIHGTTLVLATHPIVSALHLARSQAMLVRLVILAPFLAIIFLINFSDARANSVLEQLRTETELQVMSRKQQVRRFVWWSIGALALGIAFDGYINA